MLQDVLPRASDAPCRKKARNFYGKKQQPAFIVTQSVRGSELQARLNPNFNPVRTQPSVRAAHPFPRVHTAMQIAKREVQQPSSSKQAPKPIALSAFSSLVGKPDMATQESRDGASRAAEQQAWEKV